MAISIPTYDAAVTLALAAYRNRFPGRDLSTESLLGKLSRAEAMTIFMLMQAIANADNDSVPTSRTSSAALDIWAQAVGVVASTSGTTVVLGRKQGTAALGAAGKVTGTNTTLIPNGATLTASDGVTQFKLNNGGAPVLIPGVLPGTGSVSGVLFDAITTGTTGNLIVNAILTWTSPVAGCDATVVISAVPTTPGIDVESDSALLTRIQAKMQSPAKGGTSSDYRTWAESVSGVARAYAYPLHDGLGTMTVVATANGSGIARIPSGTVITAVSNYINGTSGTVAQRPVTVQGYSTTTPYMPTYGNGASPVNSGGLTIKCRLVPSKAKYNFDWDDTLSSAMPTLFKVTVTTGGAVGTAQIKFAVGVGAYGAPFTTVATGSVVPGTLYVVYTPPATYTVSDEFIFNTDGTVTGTHSGPQPTYTTGYTVLSYVHATDGTSDTVTFQQPLPGSLTSALNNNLQPRLQFLVGSNLQNPSSPAGAPAAPIQIRAISYNAGTSVITLQNPLPTGWVSPNGSQSGDIILAGGPMVTPINTAVLNYIDTLGPSRKGGYAEAVTDTWEDTAAVDRILQICLDATDTDGTRFARDAVLGGLTNITIANGKNAAASTNVQAQDSVSGIELLWARFISIVQ